MTKRSYEMFQRVYPEIMFKCSEMIIQAEINHKLRRDLPQAWKEKMIALDMINRAITKNVVNDRALAILHLMPRIRKMKFWNSMEEYFK